MYGLYYVVDGSWSPQWSSWGECSTSCGIGSRSRSKDCYFEFPECKGAECSGQQPVQTENCQETVPGK